MSLSFEALIGEDLVNHTKLTISNGENVTFYVDKKKGAEELDRFTTNSNGSIIYMDTIKTINLGHNEEDHNFIRNTFEKLDEIIDLDFVEMSNNNGSMIDIYHISYSSHFRANVIGQALSQKNTAGEWWDVFWKDSPLTGAINVNSNKNTIIHELGHVLGLRHPFNDPSNKNYDSEDTIMSYNMGYNGWDTWFSKADLNALKKIWGRENDNGFITLEENSRFYKYKKASEKQYLIQTEIGYEVISNLKNLKFKDRILNVQNDIIDVFDLMTGVNEIPSQIYRLYNAAFGRFPDKTGLDYWIQKNKSMEEDIRNTAYNFIISNEFTSHYGIDMNNDEFLDKLYENILGRDPDINGYNYWLNQLSSGIENRHEILIGFSESSENIEIFSMETSIF